VREKPVLIGSSLLLGYDFLKLEAPSLGSLSLTEYINTSAGRLHHAVGRRGADGFPVACRPGWLSEFDVRVRFRPITSMPF
jgi:hypothetical protein